MTEFNKLKLSHWDELVDIWLLMPTLLTLTIAIFHTIFMSSWRTNTQYDGIQQVEIDSLRFKLENFIWLSVCHLLSVLPPFILYTQPWQTNTKQMGNVMWSNRLKLNLRYDWKAAIVAEVWTGIYRLSDSSVISFCFDRRCDWTKHAEIESLRFEPE